MGLLVWLPLNGDVENKGASLTTIINNSAVVDNAGKIGKCYSFNGNNYYISLAVQQLFNCFKGGSTPFSICMWVYHGDSRRAILFGDWSTANSIGFNIELSTAHAVRFYWNSNPDYWPGEMIVGANTWSHITITYDGSTITSYLNGVKKATRSVTLAALNKTAGEFRLGRDNRTTDTALNGKLNDVRIYDHCLSAAEVHEISQGLVLHYKLDSFQGGYGNPNIIVTHSNAGVDGTGTSGWSSAGTGWSNSFVSATGATGGHAIRCTYANTSQTSGGIHHPTGIDKTTLTTGDIYTLSARIRTSKACVVTFQNELMTTGHSINATTEWQIYTYTCAIDTSKKYQSNVMYVRAADAVQNMWIECDWIKLEKGTAATPWQPSGVIGTAIQDSSGYGHNGTTVTPQPLTPDTPRYSAAYTCNGNVSHRIYCNSTDCNFTDNFSFAVWCKANHTGTTSQYLFTVGRADAGGYGYGINNNGDTNLNVRFGNAGYNVTIVKNEWTHIAFTKTGNTIKIYKNGVIVSTNTFSGTLPTYSDGKGIGLGCFHYASGDIYPAYGTLSDFRIYCTALSAADVKQLYEVGAKVDNKHSLHTYEFLENNSNKITKQGQIQASQISEFNGLSFLKYDPNTYIEPDGSAWIRIYHHNNPGAGSFSSSNDFAHSVYIDENRWFNVEVCNHLDKWEFMVKGKFTSTSNEWKLRWIQTVNPMTAVYADVAAANVTKITTGGYSAYTSSWGGLYAKKGSAYLTTNNGNSGNWWGAVGSYSVYQNGIPGWGPTGTITTTGFNDLYVRIDNITLSNMTIKSTKNNIWTANNLIEL